MSKIDIKIYRLLKKNCLHKRIHIIQSAVGMYLFEYYALICVIIDVCIIN